MLIIKEELVSKLKKIGLNEYEARTYLTLTTKNQQTAKQVSKNSKVPYSRIYDVLNSLKKDWIQITDKNPKKYQAKHETYTLNQAKQKYQNLFEEIKEEIKTYRKTSYQKQKSEMLLLEDWKNITNLFNDQIKTTQKNITTMLGFKSKYYNEFLKRTKNKRIDIKIITKQSIDLELDQQNNIQKHELPFAPKIWITWFDWEKIIAIFPSTKKQKIITNEVNGIFLKDKNIGEWVKQLYKTIKHF